MKNDRAASLLTTATTIVLNAVQAVFQTYVEELKKNSTFDKRSQKIALLKAKDIALSQMSNEIKDYLSTTFGDLNGWLTTQIEASINLLKNK